MAELRDNNRLRVRKKNERIAKKTSFSNFKNTMNNPVDVDAEIPAELIRKDQKVKMRVKLKLPIMVYPVKQVQGKVGQILEYRQQPPRMRANIAGGQNSGSTQQPQRTTTNVAGKEKGMTLLDEATNRVHHQDNMKGKSKELTKFGHETSLTMSNETGFLGKGNGTVRATKKQRLSDYVVGQSSKTPMVNETTTEKEIDHDIISEDEPRARKIGLRETSKVGKKYQTG